METEGFDIWVIGVEKKKSGNLCLTFIIFIFVIIGEQAGIPLVFNKMICTE
jgi:hypothetical protein